MTRHTRVLIADDEAILLLNLRELLEELGYEVVGEAHDGAEAVSLAEELEPDIALLDIKMPHMTGLEATSEIVGRKICPVVIITAFSQRDLIDQACEAGALAYLVKPYQQKELQPAIDLAIHRFAEMIELSDELDAVTDKLETRKVVDIAKGKLMDEYGLSEHDAFRFIQKTAMSSRSAMLKIAQEIIDGDMVPSA